VKKPAKAPANKMPPAKKMVTQVQPRSRSRALVPRSEHPAKQVLRELLEAKQEDRAFNQWLGEQATANAVTIHNLVEQVTAIRAEMAAERVPVPLTMVDTAQMLTINQGCYVLSGMDDKRLYRRPHLIHRIAGTCYVGNDEICAEFPDDHNQARFLEIVEKRNKADVANKAHSEPDPDIPLLSHETGKRL
jgi:hypothetical protein